MFVGALNYHLMSNPFDDSPTMSSTPAELKDSPFLAMDSEESSKGPITDLLWKKKVEQAIGTGLGHFKRAVVNQGKLALATDGGYVVRVDLTTEETSQVLVSKKLGGGIHSLFMDPLGVHIVISFISGDNFYLNASVERPVALSKMKGVVISSIAWNQNNKSRTGTGSILIGNVSGLIYELNIENGKEVQFKKVYDLMACDREQQLDDRQIAVCGLHVESFPQAREAKYFVMAATPTRHYQFVGGSTHATVSFCLQITPALDQLRASLGLTCFSGEGPPSSSCSRHHHTLRILHSKRCLETWAIRSCTSFLPQMIHWCSGSRG